MFKTLLVPAILLAAPCFADIDSDNIENYPVVNGQFEDVVYVNKGSALVDADGIPVIAVKKDSYWVGYKDFDVDGQCVRKTAVLVRMNSAAHERGINIYTPILETEITNVPCASS